MPKCSLKYFRKIIGGEESWRLELELAELEALVKEHFAAQKVSGVPFKNFEYSAVAKKESSRKIHHNNAYWKMRLSNKKLSYVQYMNLLKALSSNFLCLTVFTNTFSCLHACFWVSSQCTPVFWSVTSTPVKLPRNLPLFNICCLSVNLNLLA